MKRTFVTQAAPAFNQSTGCSKQLFMRPDDEQVDHSTAEMSLSRWPRVPVRFLTGLAINQLAPSRTLSSHTGLPYLSDARLCGDDSGAV